jgi:hypothetical protein
MARVGKTLFTIQKLTEADSCLQTGMHECTEGSRNTLSGNQQLLKTIIFSINTIANRGMT